MVKFHQSPTTYIGRVDLIVEDLERSTLFYEAILGLQILEKSKERVVFTADGQKKLLTIEQPLNINKKRRHTTGLYHFALLLPKRRDLANIVRHFINMEIHFGSGDHLVSE